MSLVQWMASTPQALTLNWGHLLVIGMIIAFFAGARVQLVWSHFVAGFRSTYVAGSFSQAFAKGFQARAAKSQFETMTPPPTPPIHAVKDIAHVASSKTHLRASGNSGS